MKRKRLIIVKKNVNFAKIVLTKWNCSVNINLQTKQTTYKNLIDDEKVDREENVRGSFK